MCYEFGKGFVGWQLIVLAFCVYLSVIFGSLVVNLPRRLHNSIMISLLRLSQLFWMSRHVKLRAGKAPGIPWCRIVD
jgi:hypothetical protein